MIVDRATDTVYLSDGTGATAEIGIPALAQAYSQGDAAKYASFMDAMQRNLNSNVAMDTVAKSGNIALAPPNGIVHPGDLQPCYVLQTQFVDYHLDSMFRWSPEGVDYSYQNWYTPEEIGRDREHFDLWQREQCSAANDEQSDAMWGFVIGALACMNPEGVITIGICAASYGDALNDSNQSYIARRNCRMTYPGPRNWGN